MDTIIGVGLLVFGLLQVVLFFKIWGMTNDVNEIKNMVRSHLNKSKPIQQTQAKKEGSSEKFEKDTLVVDLRTEKQMKTGELLANGKYKCYSNFMHVGDFAPSEIMEFNQWVSLNK